MKNAFNANLPKPNPRLKSTVSVMASPARKSSAVEGSESPSRLAVPQPPAPPSRLPEKRAVVASPPPPVAAAPLISKQSRARAVAILRETQNRGRFTMVAELEGHLHRALEARSRFKVDVEEARSVLARTANAAADALHQLAGVDKQIQDRTQVLRSLLKELDELKDTRAETMLLARRFARLDHGVA